jgi:predicted amidohydrolase YtcJ
MTAHVVAGGPIRTMADGAAPEALALRDGRIAHAGALADCRTAAGAGAQEIDLSGRTALPGFVDAHCHPVMLGETWSWVDVSEAAAPSIADLQARLRERMADLPAGAPLFAYGYNHRRLAERRHPTAADLDAVAGDREIYVMNASGHGGILNTHGLKVHGIHAGTRDVPGGEIGRDAAGHPTGLVMDAACDLLTGETGVKIGRHGPNLHLPTPPDKLDEHFASAQRAMLRHGVTTAVDAQVTRRELETYRRALDAGTLRLRMGLRILSAFLDDVLRLGLTGPLGGERLDIVGIKLYADGTLGGCTAWFPCGYHCDPSQHGLLYHTPEQFHELVLRCHQAGLHTGTHAQSPDAIAMVMDAIEAAVAATGGRTLPHTVEHCGLVSDPDIARMVALGVRPNMQPAHHHRYGDAAVEAVGEETGTRYNPAGLFARAGMLPVLSSDAPVSEPNPLEAVRTAVDRTTVAGHRLGGAELALDVQTALLAHTAGGARAAGRGHEVGTLETGKRADLVVLTGDPTAATPDELRDIAVAETWIGGEQVYSAV